MLAYYSIVLAYFVTLVTSSCTYGSITICFDSGSSSVKDLGIGITSFLLTLVICELACSIGSVVLSSKAYCKFCNTCNFNDCCTCLGCCECSIAPLNVQQVSCYLRRHFSISKQWWTSGPRLPPPK